MGWVSDRIDAAARRLAVTASDLPLQRAVDIHATELRELVAIGVTLGRLAEALATAGIVGRRSGKGVSADQLGKMIAKAPAAAPIAPPVALSAPTPLPAQTTAPSLLLSRPSKMGKGLAARGSLKR
jgi:hypothetical protein